MCGNQQDSEEVEALLISEDPQICLGKCLENPRDRGAWWAAVYGVAQNQTRLKRLSSSSRPMQLGWCYGQGFIYGPGLLNLLGSKFDKGKECMSKFSGYTKWKNTKDPDCSLSELKISIAWNIDPSRIR